MAVVAMNQSLSSHIDLGALEADDTWNGHERRFSLPGALTSWDNVGLVTEFGAIPEASTWAMMLLGFAGLAYPERKFSKQIVENIVGSTMRRQVAIARIRKWGRR